MSSPLPQTQQQTLNKAIRDAAPLYLRHGEARSEFALVPVMRNKDGRVAFRVSGKPDEARDPQQAPQPPGYLRVQPNRHVTPACGRRFRLSLDLDRLQLPVGRG